MKPKYLFLLYATLLLTGSIALVACNDRISDEADPYAAPGNNIIFYLSSGLSDELTDTLSRALNYDPYESFSPLIFENADDTLYLHRYIATEQEVLMSRSTPVNSVTDFRNIIGDAGFSVMATFTDDESVYFPLSKAVHVATRDDDVWHAVNPLRYWPAERRLRFQAYAPAGVALSDVEFGKETTTFSYTVPKSETTPRTDAESQPDLMLATAVCAHSSGTVDTDKKVPLNFRHALAAIKFAIRDVTNGKIVDISLSGVAGSGKCVYRASDSSNPFVWSSLSDKTEYVQNFNVVTEDHYPDEIPTVAIDIPEKTFMLIPQEIPSDAMMYITLESGGVLKKLGGKLWTEDIPEWEAGKEYVYTISTTAENWTYVFEVIGSSQTENYIEPEKGTFADAAGVIEVNPTVTSGAYYKVKSYRQRTNKPSIVEPLEWSATPTNGVSEVPEGLEEYSDRIKALELSPADWLLDTKLSGTGNTAASLVAKKENVFFADQYFATDYRGDWEMRDKPENGTEANPVDLSKVNGSQTTANTYVVNAGGWYKLPLVYGNAIVNGQTNSKSYILTGKTAADRTYDEKNVNGYVHLMTFTDYLGRNITGPNITGAQSAQLLWEDAYGLISDVRLNAARDYMEFYVSKDNIQQGNAVVAIRDAQGRIMWSWHIWTSDHWVNDNLTLGNGDVTIGTFNSSVHPANFVVSPRNLGWCDPKDLWYLKRAGTMVVEQTATGKKVELKILQRAKEIEYWEGNNTYYQYGRKDPFVGFINQTSDLKYNFGEVAYRLESIKDARKTIADGIQHPATLYVGGPDTQLSLNDWLETGYINLWNNYPGRCLTNNTQTHPTLYDAYRYATVKTVYDPSPAGYMMAPTGLFYSFINGTTSSSNLNGSTAPIPGSPSGYYYYYVNDVNGVPDLLLTCSGHRWYADSNVGPGNNFNPQYVYIWSSQISFRADRTSLGFAGSYGSYNTMFYGRRSMARPVRCVKE